MYFRNALALGLVLLLLIYPLTCTLAAEKGTDDSTQTGQEPASKEKSADELAKAAQNPVSSMISLPLQNNTSFGIGPYNRVQNVLNFQPVIPVNLGKWNLINRTIIPVLYQPDISRAGSGWGGIGDINHTAFLSPAEPGKLIWGVGPIISLPTATDKPLGSGKWSAGPSAVVLTMPGNWVIGALASNIWSFAGDTNRSEVNRLTFQYFVNYNLPNGWYLTSAPIITADWTADNDDRWLVPFGGGVGKIFKIGPQPMNAQVAAFYNAVRPDNGPVWSLRMQLQFMFPK